MKEAITNLGKDETLQLQLLFSQHHLDPSTATKAQKYYRQLRKLNLLHSHSLTLDILMKTSIVIAEQSQPVCDLRGQKAGPLCMALNQMLLERPTVRGILQGLKIYLLQSNRPNEQSLRSDLSIVMDKIQFGLNFIIKFQKTIKYFDFVEVASLKTSRTDSSWASYLEVFKSFAWLMFLVMSQKIQTLEPFESDYLLISVLYLMVRYVFDYLRPSSALRIGTNKDIISNILNQLFQIFEIDHPQTFKNITAEVDDLFQQLIDDRTLRITEPYDFLSPKLIKHNYKRIDALYSSQHDPHGLDYRLLLQNRESTLTPNKNIKQSHIRERVRGEQKRKSFASHKILNFQGEDVQEPVNFQPKNPQIKLPHNVKVSPSYIRTPLICVHQPSPSPSSIEHYMTRVVKSNKLSLNLLENEKEVLDMIRKILAQSCGARIKEKVLLSYNYYMVLSGQYFQAEKWDQQDYNGIHCSSLVFSLLFSLFSQSQDPDFPSFLKKTLKTIRQKVAVNAYQLWLICSYLLRCMDKPGIIEQSLNILQELILNQLIWQEETSFLIEHYTRQQNREDSIRGRNFEVLISEIIQKSQKLVRNIVESFDFEGREMNFVSEINSVMKQLLVHASQTLSERHLFQIVLSSVYLIFRQEHTNIRFNDIIAHHQQTNNVSSTELKRIVTQIEIQIQGDMKKVNIINFYNLVFLPVFKNLQHIPEEDMIRWSSSGSNRHQQRVYNSNRRAVTEISGGSHAGYESNLARGERNSNNHSFTELAKASNKHGTMSSEDRREEELRDETRLRERPSGGFLSNLRTEKVKSPTVLR